MQEPIPQHYINSIANKILQLSTGYNRLSKQPYTFYDLKRICEELRELNIQLKIIQDKKVS